MGPENHHLGSNSGSATYWLYIFSRPPFPQQYNHRITGQIYKALRTMFHTQFYGSPHPGGPFVIAKYTGVHKGSFVISSQFLQN